MNVQAGMLPLKIGISKMRKCANYLYRVIIPCYGGSEVMIKGTKAVAGMNIKRLAFGICVAFVLSAFVGVSMASAKTIYVPDNYAKIQWAVDNASVGDTIVVRDGVYVENIDINKSLTINSENGSANCVVQAADSKDHVFYVTADNVTISGFTATGTTHILKAGIYLYNSNNCRIENVNASNNYYGISLWYSNNNTIATRITVG